MAHRLSQTAFCTDFAGLGWRFAVMGKADKRRYKILRGKGAESLPKSTRVFDISVKVAV
jgi:hypothetical protein